MEKIAITQTKLYKKIQTEKEMALNASRHTGLEVLEAMSMKINNPLGLVAILFGKRNLLLLSPELP
jgi:hypothetical protein